jgi:hypothetical protein
MRFVLIFLFSIALASRCSTRGRAVATSTRVTDHDPDHDAEPDAEPDADSDTGWRRPSR